MCYRPSCKLFFASRDVKLLSSLRKKVQIRRVMLAKLDKVSNLPPNSSPSPHKEIKSVLSINIKLNINIKLYCMYCLQYKLNVNMLTSPDMRMCLLKQIQIFAVIPGLWKETNIF